MEQDRFGMANALPSQCSNDAPLQDAELQTSEGISRRESIVSIPASGLATRIESVASISASDLPTRKESAASIQSVILPSVELPPSVTLATPISGGMENSSFVSEGRFAGYRCPACGAGGLDSIQDAVEHCSSTGRPPKLPKDTPPKDIVLPPPKEIFPTVGRESSSNVVGVDRIEIATGALEINEAPLDSAADEADKVEEKDQPVILEQCEPAIENTLEPQNEDISGPELPSSKTKILGYCCPKCGECKLASLEEALNHCRDPEEIVGEHAPKIIDDTCPTCADSPIEFAPYCSDELLQEPPPIVLLPGEPVAYNDRGQPIISRQVDPETGYGSTMVLNENGTLDVFGKQTVTSLLNSTQDEAQNWFQELSDSQLRGLVHELGQRLLSASSTYQHYAKKFEGVSEKANLEFFGLGLDATDRELDVAYRQLSKRMHPDKNGGTEESKKRFQEMKTRYEELKKKRGASDDTEKKEKEDKDKDEDDGKTLEFDPTKRECLNETATKMLSQLSTLDSSLETLVSELRKHGFDV